MDSFIDPSLHIYIYMSLMSWGFFLTFAGMLSKLSDMRFHFSVYFSSFEASWHMKGSAKGFCEVRQRLIDHPSSIVDWHFNTYTEHIFVSL